MSQDAGGVAGALRQRGGRDQRPPAPAGLQAGQPHPHGGGGHREDQAGDRQPLPQAGEIAG